MPCRVALVVWLALVGLLLREEDNSAQFDPENRRKLSFSGLLLRKAAKLCREPWELDHLGADSLGMINPC